MSANESKNKSDAKKPEVQVPTVKWLFEPEDHDYPAAKSYLSLITDPEYIDATIDALNNSKTVTFKAKDILRASRLELLKPTNKHVAADLVKISHGVALSPVLLIRGDIEKDIPLTVADGYHRICASYSVDENTDIPCKIAVIKTRRVRG